MKRRVPASTHKKVVVRRNTGDSHLGYLNPAGLGRADVLDLLTTEGEHVAIALSDVACVYFVRDFNAPYEPERKAFFSRPKFDGLWVRLTFRDHDTLEGVVANNLLDLLENGIQLTPPDMNGNCLRLFIPHSALMELKVLGVVGAARRTARRAKAVTAQPNLFNE